MGGLGVWEGYGCTLFAQSKQMVFSGTTLVCEQWGFKNVVVLVYLNVYMTSHPPILLHGNQTITKQNNKQNGPPQKKSRQQQTFLILKNTPPKNNPHLEQSPPRHHTLCYSLFLQKPTQDISLLRIFQWSHIVLHSYQYVQCVCVCVCACVRGCMRACVRISSSV